MDVKDKTARYGIVAVALHWTSAAAVFLLLPLGFLAAASSDTARSIALLRIHVPMGILVLLLTILRLAWWRHDPRPDAVAGPRWQVISAKATHLLLYAVLILMGSSGIGLMIASGAGSSLFGDEPAALPQFTRYAPMVIHALGAFALVALLILHVGAALYHQLYRRDATLLRMAYGPRRR